MRKLSKNKNTGLIISIFGFVWMCFGFWTIKQNIGLTKYGFTGYMSLGILLNILGLIIVIVGLYIYAKKDTPERSPPPSPDSEQ